MKPNSQLQISINIHIANLNSETKSARISAVEALGRMGAVQAISSLLDITKDVDVEIRTASIQAIGRLIGKTTDQVTLTRAAHCLTSLLQDQNKKARIATIRALGRIKNKDTIDTLLGILRSKEEDECEAAAQLLGALCSRSDDSSLTDHILKQLITGSQDQDVSIRKNMLTALGIILPHLEHTGYYSATIDVIRKALRHNNSENRVRAANALLHTNMLSLTQSQQRELIKQLIHTLHRRNYMARANAVKALSEMAKQPVGQNHQKKIIEALIQTFNEKELNIIETIAEWIEERDHIQQRFKVNKDIKQDSYKELVNEIPKLRNPIAAGLAKLLISIIFWITLIVENLREIRILHIGMTAADAVAEIGENSIVPLIKSIHSINRNTRISSIRTLRKTNDPRVYAPLIKRLSSFDEKVRIASIRALGEMRVHGATQPLLQSLRDKKVRVRQEAALALKNIKVINDLEPLYQALQDRNAAVRQVAVQALGEIGDSKAAPALLHMLRDPDSNTRSAAVVALSQMGGADTVETIKQALPDRDVRKTAAGILKALGWIPDNSLAAVYYWLAEGNYAQCAACGTIALPALTQELALLDNNDDVQAKAGIIAALGDIGAPQIVPELVTLLENCTYKTIPYDYSSTDSAKAKIRPGYIYTHHAKTLSLAIATALGKIGNEQATSSLCNVLRNIVNSNDDSSAISNSDEIPAVLEALGTIADWRAVSPTLTILTKQFGKWRDSAAKTLDQIGWEPDATENGAAYRVAKHDWENCFLAGSLAVNYLVILFEDTKESIENRQKAAEVLGRIGDPRSIQPLIKALEYDQLRKYASEALEAIGTASIDSLIKALSHPNANIRSTALWSLANIASRTREKNVPVILFTELNKVLKTDDNDIVRKSAIKALGNLACQKDASSIREQIITTLIDTLGANSVVSEASIKTLAQIGMDTVLPLIEVVKKKNNERASRAAVRVLEKIGGNQAHETVQSYYENLGSSLDLRVDLPRIKTFRVFVSSTFSDFREERENLQESVFPSLQTLCERLGARFQAIDLRWGVSEEASRTQKAIDICLQEIARCQETSAELNFIALIGNRYGAIPIPSEIPAIEFGNIIQKLSPADADLLEWRPDQNSRARGWYRRDDNAKPAVYCLQARPKQVERLSAEQYSAIVSRLQNPTDQSAIRAYYVPDSEMDPAGYALSESSVLGERTEREKTIALVAGLSWEITEEKIRHILYDTTNDPAYITSATHHEIKAGIPETGKVKDHKNIFCFMKETVGLPKSKQAKDYMDVDGSGQPNELLQARLQGLKEYIIAKLPPENIFRYTAHWAEDGITADWEQFKKDVYQVLSRAIVTEMSRLEGVNPLEYEIDEHKKFAEDQAKSFKGREDVLATIRAYLESNSNIPAALIGISGSGKTALMAQIACSLIHTVYPQLGREDVVVRFVGVTPSSTNILRLLTSICRQLAKQQDFDEDLIPEDYEGIVSTFESLLKGVPATVDRPLIVVIDALDQLKGASDTTNYNWLPAELPPNVKLIISSLPGKKNEYNSLLENKIPDENFIPVGPMNLNDCESILTGWLASIGRGLTDLQWREVKEKIIRFPLPLYLLLVFEEVRQWKSYDDLPVYSHGQTGLGDGIQGAIDDLCWRLSQDDKHGQILLNQCFGYLAAARYGLSEGEMLHLLSQPSILADLLRRSPKSPTTDKLPVVIWAQLYSDLRPYLVHRNVGGEILIALFHRHFEEAFTRTFLAGNDKIERHRKLIDYFNEQHTVFASEATNLANQRKLTELLYHCQQIQNDQLSKDVTLTALTDLDFIAAKCGIGRADELAEDYENALTSSLFLQDDLEKLNTFARFIGSRKQVLQQCPDRVYLEAFHFLDPLPANSPKPSKPWIRWSNHSLQSYSEAIPAGKILLLLQDNGYLLTQHGEDLYLWNISEMRFIRTLQGHSRYVTAATLGYNRSEIFTADHTNTIKKWNVETGICLSTIKIGNGHPIAKLLTPSAKDLFIARTNGNVELWDLMSEKCLWTYTQGSQEIIDLTLDSPAQKVIGHNNNYIQEWDLQTGVCRTVLNRKTGSVKSIFAKSEAAFLAITIDAIQGGLGVWELDSRTRLYTLTNAGQHILFAGDVHVLTWDGADKLKYWNITTGICETEFSMPKKSLRLVTTSTNGSHIVALNESNTITVWSFDQSTFRQVTEFEIDYSTAHESQDLALSPDGQILVSSIGKKLVVMDTTRGKQFGILESRTPWEEKPFTKATFSPDGDLILSGDLDGQIYIWDYSTGNVRILKEHAGPINTLYVVPHKKWLVSGSSDGTVIIWNTSPSFSPHMTIQYNNEVQQVSVSPDGRFLIISDISGKICVWDIIENKELASTFEEDAGEFVRILINRRTIPLAISISHSMTLMVWELNQGRLRHELKGHQATIFAYTTTPDENYGICWYKDALAEVWDHRTWSITHRLDTAISAAKSIIISPDNCLVIAVHGSGHDILAWDLISGKLMWKATSEAMIQRCLIWQNGHRMLLVAEEENSTISIWDATKGIFIKKLARQLYQSRSISTSGEDRFFSIMTLNDSEHAVSTCGNSTAKVWNVKTGELVKEIDVGENITALNKAINEPHIVLGGEKGAVQCYALSYGFKTLDHREKDGKAIRSIAINSHGTVYWNAEYEIQLLPDERRIFNTQPALYVQGIDDKGKNNNEVAKRKVPFNFYRDEKKRMTLVPDKNLVVWWNASILSVWDYDTLDLIYDCIRYEGGSLRAVVAPNKEQLITGDSSGSIKIWDVLTGKPIYEKNPNIGSITTITCAPDGCSYMTTSSTGPLILWDLKTRKENARFYGVRPMVACAFTPDPRRIVALDQDGEFYLLTLENL